MVKSLGLTVGVLGVGLKGCLERVRVRYQGLTIVRSVGLKGCLGRDMVSSLGIDWSLGIDGSIVGLKACIERVRDSSPGID